jgi:hypothetical protein
MTESAAVPCRLFGVPAPAAPTVLLLRRGPNAWTQLIQWQTDTDTFIDGQWLRGHLYTRRCSLSPDGTLFAYFVSKYGPRYLHSESTETWTAISRPPYFTALALWPKGDAWNGGAVFQDNRTLLLNHPQGGKPLIAPAEHLRVIEGQKLPWFGHGEDASIHPIIVQQQGWRRVETSPYAESAAEIHAQLPVLPKRRRRGRYLLQAARIWQKALADGRFVLQQANYGADFNQTGDFYIARWKLIDRTTRQAQEIAQADWADWDQQGRLLFTRAGQVWACWPQRYPEDERSLLDLNDRRPDPQPSPAWASEWPS